MSEVKVDQTTVEKEKPLLPKANPYLLREFQTRISKQEQAEKELEYQKYLETLPPQEKLKVLKQREEQIKSEKEEKKSAATLPKKTEELKPQTLAGQTISWAEYLIMGEDPNKVLDAAGKAVDVVKENAAAASKAITGRENPIGFTLTRSDPDSKRALRDAENMVFVENYRMRKLMTQVEDFLDPFNPRGRQIGDFGPSEIRERYNTRSSQEALSILATLQVVTADLAERRGDPELAKYSQRLSRIIEVGSQLGSKELEEIGYNSQPMTDEQMAEKWGLLRDGKYANVPGMGVIAQSKFPVMFFEVQQLLTSYNVMQTLVGVEKELKTLLQEVELDAGLTEEQKKTKRREIWKGVLTDRVTGSIRHGDEKDGAQIQVYEHLYGAAILAPLLMKYENGLSLAEASVFRLHAEKLLRESKDEMSKEVAERVIDAYSNAEGQGKIRDLVESKYGKKPKDLSNAEIDQAIEQLKKELGQDYSTAHNLFTEITKNLPAFIELRRAVDAIASDVPSQIDTAMKSEANFAELIKNIRASQEAVRKTISERMNMDPKQAIELADRFVAQNKEILTQEQSSIPQRIRAIAERTFGYHE